MKPKTFNDWMIFIIMNIQDIDDKLKVLKTKLSVSDGSDAIAKIQKQIKVLKLKREIETIKHKIDQLENLY